MATATIQGRMLDAAGSHSLEVARMSSREVFAREELHPVLEVSVVPRVGSVWAEFSVDRYVSSDATLGDVWGGWRVVLREVRTAPAEADSFSRRAWWDASDAQGVGPVTWEAIREACEPVIRGWLDGPAYKVSRRKAAAYAARRVLQDDRSSIEHRRQELDRLDSEVAPMEMVSLREALDHLEAAALLLDREPVA